MDTNPVKICDTTLRDAHQSLIATRLRTEDMVPIAQAIDNAGYHSVEMWGGATFDSAMRFLNENPWNRLRRLKELMPKTPFQMLLRAQNVLGYKHYPDDVLESFVKCAKRNGIDIFRVFDALNDPRNMEAALRYVKQYGGHAQAAFSYTISPIHTIADYVKLALRFKEMGADSIAIKDMAGMATPYATYEMVSELKSQTGLPVQFHTHATSGMATAAALKAVEAGVDIIDSAISSLAGTTSQPATEPLVASLQGTQRDTGLDLNALSDIAQYFAEIRKRYKSFESGISRVDVRVLQYQIPGGMLSNLISQLRQQGAESHWEELLKEVPRVREEMGFPPLVTPSSQIVGTQATLNVALGKRYKVVPEEVKQYVRGYYGRPPAPIDPGIKQLVIGDEEPITCRPADLLEPGMETARVELGELATCEEDVLCYALFPQVARICLERRMHGIDEHLSNVGAIAVRIALEMNRQRHLPTPGSDDDGMTRWEQAWLPSMRWTGVSLF